MNLISSWKELKGLAALSALSILTVNSNQLADDLNAGDIVASITSIAVKYDGVGMVMVVMLVYNSCGYGLAVALAVCLQYSIRDTLIV